MSWTHGLTAQRWNIEQQPSRCTAMNTTHSTSLLTYLQRYQTQ